MIDVTTDELKNLRDSGSLTEGEQYMVVDYRDLMMYTTAISIDSFETMFTSEDDKYKIQYDVDDNKVIYMFDTEDNNDGNFDFRENISGSVDCHLGDSNTIAITDSENVYIEGVNTGTIDKCKNINISDSNSLSLTSSSFVDIGNNNTITLSGCDCMYFGDGNEITLTNISGVHIEDGNKEITLGGSSIIESYNEGITIEGDSNIVRSYCKDITINGNCNEVEDSRYLSVGGSFNSFKKTTIATLTTAYGNEVESSDVIDITNTNNNIVASRNLTVSNRDAFMKYEDKKGFRQAENLLERVNLVADNNARVLIVDQEKFRGESDTKSNKKYIISGGEWTEVN